jgi:hypothetical protein
MLTDWPPSVRVVVGAQMTGNDHDCSHVKMADELIRMLLFVWQDFRSQRVGPTMSRTTITVMMPLYQSTRCRRQQHQQSTTAPQSP